MPEPTIRKAVQADLPYVQEIYNHYVANTTVTFDEKPLSLTQWRAKFEHINRLNLPFLVVVSESAEVLGYAYVYPWREKAAYRFTVESSIYLRVTSTGRGLGRMLLAELIRCSTEAGLKEMIAVIADQGAEASLRLHRDFGFVEVGRMRKVGYKFERWLGAVLMQKSLG